MELDDPGNIFEGRPAVAPPSRASKCQLHTAEYSRGHGAPRGVEIGNVDASSPPSQAAAWRNDVDLGQHWSTQASTQKGVVDRLALRRRRRHPQRALARQLVRTHFRARSPADSRDPTALLYDAARREGIAEPEAGRIDEAVLLVERGLDDPPASLSTTGAARSSPVSDPWHGSGILEDRSRCGGPWTRRAAAVEAGQREVREIEDPAPRRRRAGVGAWRSRTDASWRALVVDMPGLRRARSAVGVASTRQGPAGAGDRLTARSAARACSPNLASTASQAADDAAPRGDDDDAGEGPPRPPELPGQDPPSGQIRPRFRARAEPAPPLPGAAAAGAWIRFGRAAEGALSSRRARGRASRRRGWSPTRRPARNDAVRPREAPRRHAVPVGGPLDERRPRRTAAPPSPRRGRRARTHAVGRAPSRHWRPGRRVGARTSLTATRSPCGTMATQAFRAAASGTA